MVEVSRESGCLLFVFFKCPKIAKFTPFSFLGKSFCFFVSDLKNHFPGKAEKVEKEGNCASFLFHLHQAPPPKHLGD